ALLGGLDERWFGAILSVRAEAIASPLLTEVISLCYLLFFPYLVISWFTYAWRGLEIFRTLFIGLFTIYGIGFLGYSLVPAGGPHLAFPEQFGAPLSGWVITTFNARVVAEGSNGVDVFPSLHCAVTAFLLWFDRRHSPRRFRVLLVPCLGLWLATIYLRYHYFVDVIGGFALAAFGCWITQRWAAANPSNKSTPAFHETHPAL
ncbi:MAG: phosphatase PAP2 family protein, partial [Chloroflexi bacterium]|nr:phosphatase PAP2 family protein [Chloroflexota bacterium]